MSSWADATDNFAQSAWQEADGDRLTQLPLDADEASRAN